MGTSAPVCCGDLALRGTFPISQLEDNRSVLQITGVHYPRHKLHRHWPDKTGSLYWLITLTFVQCLPIPVLVEIALIKILKKINHLHCVSVWDLHMERLQGELSGAGNHQTILTQPNQVPVTYLMAFFSPRPRAESGVSAVSTPGLFLFPLSEAEGGGERKRGETKGYLLDPSSEALFVLC